ncbi:hypothetical protein Glove_421g12 [Diversispora epigaea]|uniref:Uncharacterized protein n=1 Tax=Diversispora epigaea TaxID=1348612 RepID=A0A397GX71_9GLOM|nr:hypothetical protein Glove_421g12 [Diversispora epigaea]
MHPPLSSNFASDKKFKMEFRSKKNPRQSIVIHSQHWGRSRGEYSFLPKIKSAESLPEKLGYDSLGEFYLCMPKPLEIRTENQGPLFSETREKEGSGWIQVLHRVMLRINEKIRCLCNIITTQGMIRRGQRRIRSKTARAMCTWSHYRFRKHLINKAREHPCSLLHKNITFNEMCAHTACQFLPGNL